MLKPPTHVRPWQWAVPDTGERRRVPHLIRTITWPSGRWESGCSAEFLLRDSVVLDLPALPGPEGACLDCHAFIDSRRLPDRQR